jgi:ribonuclease P protein component
MLPTAARLRTPGDFQRVTRSGRRGAAATLVVHVVRDESVFAGPRAGFVVSKKIGNSVVRHRVARRLRAVVAACLADMPSGTALVVRALPAAANATSTVLRADFGVALQRAEGRKRR